ncbi:MULTISPECIES: DegT/DnrJ/EryC1/StrS family aminotransferase [Bacillus]|uniref:DegT/DnrJ/EryC1/StrS family aminotransferase n=1 Tax=Bacillus TaxID=1386 RepID=UPI0002DBA617|nr:MULTISPECIES: DegT/DnrJ/EryC1/StrS aminotransferase family protein [Bacillus]
MIRFEKCHDTELVKRSIPFSPPDISDKEIDQVVQTLKSGWITTGPRTKLFEKKIAERIGAPCAVTLNSATAAMELTLRILGVREGDEIITTAYTYTATAAVIHHVGAKIVLMDTALDSFEIDYDKLADAITEKTKVIMPVDIGGRMCDYEKIFTIIERKRNLFTPSSEIQKLFNRIIVLADSAHGFGASYKGKNNGTVADFTCFSFHAVKNLTTVEGGAAVWKSREGLDDDWLYNQYMLYSLHGQSKDALTKSRSESWEYDVLQLGYKCNMTDIQASLGLAQLERYDAMLRRRREIIEMYDDALIPLGLYSLKHFEESSQSSGHLYMIRVSEINERQRNEVIVKMAEAGIATNVHYKPLPMFTAYKALGFDIVNYPNAFAQYQNEITLPLGTFLKDRDVEYVIYHMKKVLTEII